MHTSAHRRIHTHSGNVAHREIYSHKDPRIQGIHIQGRCWALGGSSRAPGSHTSFFFVFPFDSLLKFCTDLKSTPACFCSCGSLRSLAGLLDIKQEKPGEKRQSGKGLWIEIPRAICSVRQRLPSGFQHSKSALIPAEVEGVGFECTRGNI